MNMFCKNLQFSYNSVNVTSVARKSKAVHDYSAANINFLTRVCGFRTTHVLNLLHMKPNLRYKETAELNESYQFCKKLGFTNSEILHYPTLLVSHPLTNIHHYHALEDTGCRPIDASLLSSASKLFRGKIRLFKKGGYLNQDDNVIDNLIGVLESPIEKPEELKKNLEKLDAMPWTKVHRIILIAWLKQRLDATDNELIKLFRIHKMIKNKSYRIINENITLAESLGLDKDKILKCGYLLNNYPEYPKTVLRDFPFFAGVDFSRVYKSNPKMMMISPRRIMEIYNILKEYHISDESIKKKPDVFTMSPDTLRSRLDQIKSTPEFQVIFNHPDLLKIVVHHRKVSDRLLLMKNLKLRCTSPIQLIDLNDDNFENYVRSGEDINKVADVIIYFSKLLDQDTHDIKKKLCKHPFYRYVPFVDINDTFHYLVRLGYSKLSIRRCLFILLYPNFRISKAIQDLKEDLSFNFNKLSPSKQLKLILYTIEKEHHFTGNGIWRTDLNGNSLENDQPTLE